MRWQTIAYGVVWIVVLSICATFEPRAVPLFFTLSIFTLIFRNLGQRQDGLSAYSVFNPGCAQLLGQLQPNQFENEMRHRPLEQNTSGNSRGRRTAVTGRAAPSAPRTHDDLLEEMRAEMQQDARRTRRTGVAPSTRPRRR